MEYLGWFGVEHLKCWAQVQVDLDKQKSEGKGRRRILEDARAWDGMGPCTCVCDSLLELFWVAAATAKVAVV